MVAMATQCAQDLTLPPAQQSLGYSSYPLSPSPHDELKITQGMNQEWFGPACHLSFWPGSGQHMGTEKDWFASL